MEIWKDIKGYEGLYQVSNEGRIKSLLFNRERMLKGSMNSEGYLTVSLKGKTYHIHRLVAIAFIPNPDNKPEIDHIDTDRCNNNIKNLRWVTHKENHNNPLNHHKGKRKGVNTAKNSRYFVNNYDYYI